MKVIGVLFFTITLISIIVPILNLDNINASVNYMSAGTTTDTLSNLTTAITNVTHTVTTKFSATLASASTLGVYLQANDPRGSTGFVSLAIAGFNIVDETSNTFICGNTSSVKTVAVGSTAGGSYAINDILAITGGGGSGAQVQVTNVFSGGVTGVKLLNGGTGYTAGSNLATTKITGSGNNAFTITITVNAVAPTLQSASLPLPNQTTFGTGYTFASISCTTQNIITNGDVVQIAGFTATNPIATATNSITFIVDIQDNNTVNDEGFTAIPISFVGSNISVSMVVTPYITLGLSATTANLGTAAYNTVAGTVTPWIVLTTTTNSVSGEKVYVWDNNGNADTTGMAGGLYSSGASYTIHADSNTAATNLSTDMIHEHYDLNGGTAVSGLTVQVPYSGNDNTSAGGFLKNYSTLFASSAGALANGSSTIKFFSTVSGTTPVGAYADTVTFTAAGNF